MNFTQLQVCNLACDLVGAEPIVALTDVNPRTEACNRNYPLALAEVLRLRDWGFAGAIATLDQGDPPAFGWLYSYPLPADFVSVTKLNGDVFLGDPSGWFEIRGVNLLTNETTADLEYISFPADATYFDPLFLTALGTLLASRIATPLRQDGGDMMIRLLQVYTQALSRAGMRNANERKAVPRDPAQESQFVRSRWWQRR